MCVCVCVKLQHCVYGMLCQMQKVGIEPILCVWRKLQKKKKTHSGNGPLVRVCSHLKTMTQIFYVVSIFFMSSEIGCRVINVSVRTWRHKSTLLSLVTEIGITMYNIYYAETILYAGFLNPKSKAFPLIDPIYNWKLNIYFLDTSTYFAWNVSRIYSA